MHIIETGDGKFIARKWGIFSWVYLGRDDGFKWSTWDHARKYCAVGTEEEARDIVRMLTIARKIRL